MRPALPARRRGPVARLAAAALIAVATVLAGCGSLPTNVGKTDTLALPPNPDSPLVKIARVSSPSPEQTGVRLLPLGAYSLDTRIQLAQRASTLARRPVLRARERPDRPAADEGPARRERARRARPPPRRRPLHDPFRRAAARPGVVPQRRGAPLQPVLLQPLGRRRRPLHGVDLRLRPAQPPHAQQALHRRRRDGGGGRSQHRRRVLPALARARTSSTWTRS